MGEKVQTVTTMKVKDDACLTNVKPIVSFNNLKYVTQTPHYEYYHHTVMLVCMPILVIFNRKVSVADDA